MYFKRLNITHDRRVGFKSLYRPVPAVAFLFVTEHPLSAYFLYFLSFKISTLHIPFCFNFLSLPQTLMESITFYDLHVIAGPSVTPHGARGGSPSLSRTFFSPSRFRSPVPLVALRRRPAHAAVTTNSVPVSLFFGFFFFFFFLICLFSWKEEKKKV